jgi:hypothetical protein
MARTATASAAAVALSLGMFACSSTPREAENLPSMRDVRREQRIPPEIAHTMQIESVRRTPLRIERADFPLDAPLDEAWAVLDASGLSPGISGAWRVNGIRAGVLTADRAAEFARRLPAATGGKAQIAVPTDAPLPLIRSAAMRHAVAVDLTVPPRPVRELTLSGGRVQLLIEVVRDPMNRPVLIFTPHQFLPQQTLAVRSAEEKQLDGRMLEELSLAVLLGSGEALVIGLDVPPPPVFAPRIEPMEEEDRPADPGLQQARPQPGEIGTWSVPPAEPAEEAEPVEPPGHLQPVEDRLAPNLGRALFAATRYGRPIQMLYVIRVAE